MPNNALKEKFLSSLRDILENEPEIKNPVREAVARAGYSQPEFQWSRVANNYKDEIIGLTRDILLETGPEAAITLVRIMRGDSNVSLAARDRLSAALNILDRGPGVVKVEKVEVEVKPGVVALPVKDLLQDIPDDE